MPTKEEIYQFKVTLKDIEPPVWRRIQVPGSYSFWDLHVAIQDVMGWLGYHLHEFLLSDATGHELRIGIPDQEWENDGTLPGWELQIADYLSLERPRFQYIYDFGDDWEHDVALEGILTAHQAAVYPRCIYGERNSPPEDCGGAHGYLELLEVLADPTHDEYQSARTWTESMKGGAFDPEAFDPAAVVFSDPRLRYRQAFGDEEVSREEVIWNLIDAFDYYDGRYKRREMEQAVALREEITPHLIHILEQLAEDPKRYAAEDHYANTYAVALLSYFQEPAAHLPIIRAFSLPYELQDELWGDMTTESLPVFLFQTCNGSLDTIRSLVLDRNVHEYIRAAAADALGYAVARGMAQREDIISFLAALFTGEEAEKGGDFWSSIACTITDLHPEGAMGVIRKAYADGLIHADYVTLQEIEDQLARDPEEVMEELRAQADRKIPADLHDYLSWFACFNETDRPAFPADQGVKTDKKKKKAGKARKKMAKKSKRKNRK